MFTDDENLLSEAQERAYKAEVRHVWEHYADVCEEILMFAYDNS